MDSTLQQILETLVHQVQLLKQKDAEIDVLKKVIANYEKTKEEK